MNWTVTKVFAFVALGVATGLTVYLSDGTIWLGTMTACGVILGIKNLRQNEDKK